MVNKSEAELVWTKSTTVKGIKLKRYLVLHKNVQVCIIFNTTSCLKVLKKCIDIFLVELFLSFLESFCPDNYPYPLNAEGKHCCKYSLQVPFVPFEDCIDNATKYIGNDNQTIDDVQSADDCKLKCQEDQFCKYWSWEVDGNVCQFKIKQEDTEQNVDFISGPKFCPGKLINTILLITQYIK